MCRRCVYDGSHKSLAKAKAKRQTPNHSPNAVDFVYRTVLLYIDPKNLEIIFKTKSYYYLFTQDWYTWLWSKLFKIWNSHPVGNHTRSRAQSIQPVHACWEPQPHPHPSTFALHIIWSIMFMLILNFFDIWLQIETDGPARLVFSLFYARYIFSFLLFSSLPI